MRITEGKLLLTKKELNKLMTENKLIETLKQLTEAYYATYSFEQIKNYVITSSGIEPENFFKEKDSNRDYVIIVIITDFKNGENGEKIRRTTDEIEDETKKVEDAMLLSGWFRSITDRVPWKGGTATRIQYEKRHKNNANNTVRSKKYLYHLTPSIHVDKIKQIGLVPKTKNKKFEYTPRIHFFLYRISYDKAKDVATVFYNEEGLKKEKYDGKYTLLKINVPKIPNNIEFFYDPNTDNAVYTKQNIPPSAIEIEYELNIF
jgi:hypothetical protein